MSEGSAPEPGRFVVLEGGEGSGKSTQAGLLAARLRTRGLAVLETFEPGATTLGGSLRALLLDGDAPVDPVAEALLMAADRAQHVVEVIRPALLAGRWVVSDRYVPSSLAYQGVARGLGLDAVLSANAWATDGLDGDLVVVLDVPDAVAEARIDSARDRMERAGDEFHARVRAAYRELAAGHGWVVVDGSTAAAEVAATIWQVVARRFDISSVDPHP